MNLASKGGAMSLHRNPDAARKLMAHALLSASAPVVRL
jgi:hypothetical protein